jgi:hypothetical protein
LNHVNLTIALIQKNCVNPGILQRQFKTISNCGVVFVNLRTPDRRLCRCSFRHL